jgi:hypothetical protein
VHGNEQGGTFEITVKKRFGGQYYGTFTIRFEFTKGEKEVRNKDIIIPDIVVL